MNIEQVFEAELVASEQQANAHRERLLAALTFPVKCAWCFEGGWNDPKIYSSDELGGFDPDNDLPVCRSCWDDVIDQTHS